MRLVCPSCGALHSAEAWTADGQARQCLKIVAELPESVSRRVLAYLALFRPTARGLKWSKALRLLAELQQLVREPHIGWEQKPARANDPAAWVQALDQVVENPPKRLPLKTHGYLRAIAYERADELDRAAERRRIVAEQTGNFRRAATPPAAISVAAEAAGAAGAAATPPTAEQMRALSQKLKRIGG